MQPHQQRVVDELVELQEKIIKLDNFISSENFEKIVVDKEERHRLIAQLGYMRQYASVLIERIDNFN